MSFFFSSRRRHTILQGDWSSDVCSSDLPDLRIDPLPARSTAAKPRVMLPPPRHGWTAAAVLALVLAVGMQIGRASCRERVAVGVAGMTSDKQEYKRVEEMVRKKLAVVFG